MTEKQRQWIAWIIVAVAIVAAGFLGVTYPVPAPPAVSVSPQAFVYPTGAIYFAEGGKSMVMQSGSTLTGDTGSLATFSGGLSGAYITSTRTLVGNVGSLTTLSGGLSGAYITSTGTLVGNVGSLATFSGGLSGAYITSTGTLVGNVGSLATFSGGLSGAYITSTKTLVGPAEGSVLYTARHRVTAAEINAGHVIVTVPAGLKFRLVNAIAVPYGGGTCGSVTTVNISSTVALATYAQANMTQSNIMDLTATGVTLLADGASFSQQGDGVSITIAKVGAPVDTCTGVDFVISYALEP